MRATENEGNRAVTTGMLTGDRRIEMGILAMRQRRRFKQVKRLGLRVPSSYGRIHAVTTLPAPIQEELFKYPETVENDSSYESDSRVRQKYKDDPVAYILGSDARKRQAVLQ